MPKSAYIHIPFCESKCKYCSFVSYKRSELITKYIDKLLHEIDLNYKGEILNTIYFGGGTPSIISVELLSEIIKKFKYNSNTEITIEINPDDADLKFFKSVKQIGFNRISIGSQTFDNNILKIIGRRHSANDIIKSIEFAQQTGFNNISVDLIYGLPTQTIKILEKDLEKFLELNIQHISTYGLKIDEGSAWYNNPPSIPNDDIQADMYLLINEVLEKNKFYRYEVSNFAKKGYESHHNLNYWDNAEYYGFGAAAHGYVNGIRYSNCSDIEKYIQQPYKPVTKHIVTQQEKLEEEIFLGFRKTEGININQIFKKYGINFEHKYQTILNKYSDYIIKTQNGFTLNTQGTMLSNVILADFLEDL